MFSAKFISIGSIVAGILALLPAVGLVTVGPIGQRGMCRPLCAFYDFATGVFGVQAANVGLGLLSLRSPLPLSWSVFGVGHEAGGNVPSNSALVNDACVAALRASFSTPQRER